MSEGRKFAGGLLAAGVALMSGLATPAFAAADGPGPNLVLEVAGQGNGRIVIDLLSDVAPEHAARLATLAQSGAYDDVVFHRVIDGFMAQTGDVEHGKSGGNLRRAGTGGSDLPDLPAEFSKLPHARGTLGAARSANPNSANSQFFINFKDNDFLNGQYTVYGRVIDGMAHVDRIARGEPPAEPDQMITVRVAADVQA
ncbi:MAG: peptidylprolyl isomerase [Tropicimonas sp.]|uniref:peptidylprolyl isomerase n=1 Tax=Tropicimonas sp. TaxID=2067044 RepID=UPI003A860002